MKQLYAFILLLVVAAYLSACKKDTVTVIDYSKITLTDAQCNVTAITDSTQWSNDVYWTAFDSSLVKFTDSISFTDSLTGKVEVSPACPNPSQGQFIVGVNTERACKMKVVCLNTSQEVLYFNSQLLTGGPIIIGFDFRSISAFHTGQYYRMYYAFYTAADSMYYRGHGDFKIQ
jgi:hypothetical protein